MSYTVTITNGEDQIYEQKVEALDLVAVINAVNRDDLTKTQLPPRKRALRSDAGKPKTVLQAATSGQREVEVTADPFG